MISKIRGLFAGKKKGKRGFQDLMASRLANDWLLSTDDPNLRLTQHLGELRSKARDMAETNHYAISYLNLRIANVVGPDGFKLQSQVGNRDGSPDYYARETIERLWNDWQQSPNCTVGADSHFNEVSRMMERVLATDGEVFVWVYPGYDNSHRFAMRVLEADFIDHELNLNRLPNSANKVIMGKEIDTYGRVVAFWVNGEHPGALHAGTYSGKKRYRVPAISEYINSPEFQRPAKTGYILHQFEERRPGQQRGIPPLAAVMTPLRLLERTEEAHATAARLSSCAVFQQVQQNADEWDQDGSVPGADSMDIAPGFIAQNGMGRKWEVLQPAFPNSDLPDHGKYTLKGAGQALGVSYPTFSGDLEGTSYSSGRLGALAERDAWRVMQDSAIRARMTPLFYAWLRTQLAYDQLGSLSTRGEQRYRMSHFQGRRWDWVDPAKDAKGKREELAMKITTPQRIIIERGGDPEEIMQEWTEYELMLEKAGVQAPDYMSEQMATDGESDGDGAKLSNSESSE